MWMSFCDVSEDAPRYKQSAIEDSLSQLRCNLKIFHSVLEGVYGCGQQGLLGLGYLKLVPYLFMARAIATHPVSEGRICSAD